MTRYVALLGSINVGGNRLTMADLKAAMEAEGFTGVTTVAASGNVLFDVDCAPDAKPRTAHCKCGANPLRHHHFAGEGEDKLVHVHMLERQPATAAFDKLLADHAGRGPERLAPGTRSLHIDDVSGVGTSRLTGDFIARRLGCRGTARNIRPLRRIIEIMDQ